MTRVELSELARRQLHELVRTRELPVSTYNHVDRAIDQLRLFPLSGQAAHHYRYDDTNDVVSVVGFIDGRTWGAPRP